MDALQLVSLLPFYPELTLTQLPNITLNAYIKATGAVLEPIYGLYKITEEQHSRLEKLKFVIGSKIYYLSRDAQILPRKYNRNFNLGLDLNGIYLAVAPVRDYALSFHHRNTKTNYDRHLALTVVIILDWVQRSLSVIIP